MKPIRQKEGSRDIRHRMRPLRIRQVDIVASLAVIRRIALQAPQELDHGVQAVRDGGVRHVEVGGDVPLEDLREEVPAVLVDGDGEEVDEVLDFEDGGCVLGG